MGQIADDAIEGLSCSGCGVYFTEAHGHPVVCKDCHKEGGWQYPKAYLPEIGEDEESE